MKLLLTTVAAVGMIAASAAYAAPVAMTATLATPAAKETSLIASGASWRCKDTTCKLTSSNSVNVFGACRDIARQLGPVTQIGTAEKPLAEDKLAKCNAGLK